VRSSWRLAFANRPFADVGSAHLLRHPLVVHEERVAQLLDAIGEDAVIRVSFLWTSLSIGPRTWTRDSERGSKAGERGRFGENVRWERASESFGFDDVGSGVSGSEEDDVDCSE
jgi:hypothetical protein